MVKYYSIYITLCFIPFASCSKDDDTVDVPTDRTIIVYIAADNDLSEDAWDNINEMQSGYEEKGANLIVFSRTGDNPKNNETRQGETPEVQPHGAALPP